MASNITTGQRSCIDVSLPADGSAGMLALVLGIHCFLAAAVVAMLGTFLCWCGLFDQFGDLLIGRHCVDQAANMGIIGTARNDFRCVLALSLGGMLTFFLQCRHGEMAFRSTTMRALTENMSAAASLI